MILLLTSLNIFLGSYFFCLDCVYCVNYHCYCGIYYIFALTSYNTTSCTYSHSLISSCIVFCLPLVFKFPSKNKDDLLVFMFSSWKWKLELEVFSLSDPRFMVTEWFLFSLYFKCERQLVFCPKTTNAMLFEIWKQI